jgi:hypothetical protein
LLATMTSGFAPAKSTAETYVGSLPELTSLALGGATYGFVQQTALKFFPGIYRFAEKIPGIGPIVGPATPTLLIGALLHKIGDMQKIDALKMVGRGLLGASVVGMAMTLTKKIMPMGEADFDGIPEGLGYEQVSLGEGADFEGEYEQVSLGEGADFEGVEAFSGVEAFQGVPEGMGYGQLG